MASFPRNKTLDPAGESNLVIRMSRLSYLVVRAPSGPVGTTHAGGATLPYVFKYFFTTVSPGFKYSKF